MLILNKIQQMMTKKVEAKSDANWKQSIQLSDDDSQILILSDDGGVESKVKEVQEDIKEIVLPINLHQIETSSLQPLLYLDEPGLQMYISADPDITNLLNCFYPKALTVLFLCNINMFLQSMIRKDFPDEQQLQTVLTKKKFGDQEVNQYLGMTMLFGIFRLPTVASYWHCDTMLKGGVDVCMQEGRYKFIESNHMTFPQESDNQRALLLITDMRQKWKKMYKPDQDLILHQHKEPTYTTTFLLDSETLFILDEAIIFEGQLSLQPIQKMLGSFYGKNHIVYFSTDSLNLRLILKLVESAVYPVGRISISNLLSDEEGRQFVQQFIVDDLPYVNEKICFVKEGEQLLVFPHRKLKMEGEETPNFWHKYRQLVTSHQTKATHRIQCINNYKNPFSYQASLNEQLAATDQCPSILYHKIMFEEFFEGTIYNMFCFYSSILINTQQKQTYKQFKIDVAGQLIGEKFMQLQRDRQEILRKAQLVQCVTGMQSDKLSFGLPGSYPMEGYHFPMLLERSMQVKFCIVCMKYENLSKSFFHCLLCQRQVGSRIFLCIFPCFELFHKNPNSFVHVDYQNPQILKEEKQYQYQQEGKQLEVQRAESRLPVLLPDQIRSLPSLQIENKSLLERSLYVVYKNRGPPPNPFSKSPKNNQIVSVKKTVGFRRKGDDDDPIEKDFEELINNINKPPEPAQPPMLTHERTQYKPIAQELFSYTPRQQPTMEPRVVSREYRQHDRQPNVVNNNQISTQAPLQSQLYTQTHLPTPKPQYNQPVPQQIIQPQHQQLQPQKQTQIQIQQQAQQQTLQQTMETEPSYKSPFEKFMEQCNKKNKTNRQQKIEETH